MARFPLRPPVAVAAPQPAAPPPVEEFFDIPDEEPISSGYTIRSLFWKATIWLLVALGIQTLASLSPSLVELVYSQTIYFHISRLLTYVNRYFTISLGEIFFGMVIIWFILWTLWYLRRAFRGETRVFDVIKILFLHLTWTFSTLFVLFLLLWGLNFQRMPISDSMGLIRRPARSDELQAIGARIYSGINKNYDDAAAGQAWSGTSRLPMSMARLNEILESSFQNTPMLGEARQGGLGVPKPLYSSRIAGVFGAEGFFIPYSGEPLYNEAVPNCDLPFVIARQKAHQRGFAREDEANLVAYIICTNASDPYVRYSGFLHGVKVLEEIEKSGVGQYRDKVGRGPSTDLDAKIDYWFKTKSDYPDTLLQRLTGLYLRINRVRRGYENFDEDIPLIIGYYLKSPTFQPRESSPASVPPATTAPQTTAPTLTPRPVGDGGGGGTGTGAPLAPRPVGGDGGGTGIGTPLAPRPVGGGGASATKAPVG